MTRYCIGVDFGTLSARAVLVNVDTGEIVCTSEYTYSKGVIEGHFLDGRLLDEGWALQDPMDYMEALVHAIRGIMADSRVRPEQVLGIGTDFTSSTMIPVRYTGTPLCYEEEFRLNPYAYAMLWKHHAAQAAANRINSLAYKLGEDWIKNYGGRISAEWGVPKLLQICEEAPEVYKNIEVYIEAVDWIVWQLTGRECHSYTTMEFKTMWSQEHGFPDPAFFAALHADFSNAIDKLGKNYLPAASCAGGLCEQMAKKLNLPAGIPVAVGMVDAYASLPAVGIAAPEELLLILGTSVCEIMVESNGVRVPGMCGLAKDGIIPGYYAHEAAQSAGGDLFSWYVRNYCTEAPEEAHYKMTHEASALLPGQSGLVALDWWNGNNCILDDMDLSGILFGLTLNTTRAEVYRALLESVAYGTRVNVEQLQKHGIPIRRIVASGGISRKNQLLMQIYADVLNMPIYVSSVSLGPALGSAMFAAVAVGKAGGGYDSIEEASSRMGAPIAEVYYPETNAVDVYDQLFHIYMTLHDRFGLKEPELMYTLKKLKTENRRKENFESNGDYTC